MSGERIRDGAAMLHAAIDQLLTTETASEFSGLSGPEVTALLVEIEQAHRRLATLDHQLITEITTRALAGDYGRTSTADLLTTLLRVTPAEAKARVTQAGDLGPRRTLQGESLPPLLPIVCAAVQTGDLSAHHVSVITRALDDLSPTVSPGTHHIVETTLVQAARHQHPGQLGKTAALLLARIDPDGLEPTIAEHERRREFTLAVQADGSSRPHGRLTPEVTAVWTTILDTLSTPVGAAASDTTSLGPAGSGAAGFGASGDPTMDRRTAGQRRHDALAETGRLLLRSGELHPAGGMPVTVLVRVTAEDLAAGTGVALTDRGATWPVHDLLTSLSDAALVPVHLAATGAVLWLGRTERLATRALRLALHARDGGCTFPGCDRPASWTEVHHVIAWCDGGPTDIDNLALLCRFHHREFERHGWQARITDGVPEWIPPPWVDPLRRPQRNTVHRPPDIHFDHERAAGAA